MLLNCGVGEDSWESLGLQGDPTSPFHPKGNQSWIFIGRTDAEAESPILWPPDVKSWIIRKDPDAGKDWGQEEKEVTEGEMVGWHHQLIGYEFEQVLRDGERLGSLLCCSPWVHKESDTTEQLNSKCWDQRQIHLGTRAEWESSWFTSHYVSPSESYLPCFLMFF